MRTAGEGRQSCRQDKGSEEGLPAGAEACVRGGCGSGLLASCRSDCSYRKLLLGTALGAHSPRIVTTSPLARHGAEVEIS